MKQRVQEIINSILAMIVIGACCSPTSTPQSEKPWRFTIIGGEKITGTAEVRTKPDWVSHAVFKIYPASFEIEHFDPHVNILVVQWPSEGMPQHWMCEGTTLKGTVIATAPDGKKWIGKAVSNGMGGCDIGLVISNQH